MASVQPATANGAIYTQGLTFDHEVGPWEGEERGRYQWWTITNVWRPINEQNYGDRSRWYRALLADSWVKVRDGSTVYHLSNVYRASNSMSLLGWGPKGEVATASSCTSFSIQLASLQE